MSPVADISVRVILRETLSCCHRRLTTAASCERSVLQPRRFAILLLPPPLLCNADPLRQMQAAQEHCASSDKISFIAGCGLLHYPGEIGTIYAKKKAMRLYSQHVLMMKNIRSQLSQTFSNKRSKDPRRNFNFGWENTHDADIAEDLGKLMNNVEMTSGILASCTASN